MEETVRGLYSSGKEAFERKDYDLALESLTSFVEKVDSFPDVWNFLGQIYHDRGELRRSAECFEKALSLNPRYVEVQFNLAVVYTEVGEYDKAQELYEKARQVEKEPIPGDKRIADPFVRGKLANMHADLGGIYHGLGLFDDAASEFEKALALRPDFPDVRTRLAKAIFDSGLKDEAVAELMEVKATRPDYAEARILLGVFLYSQERTSDAVAEWKELVAKQPDNHKAKMYLRLAGKPKK